MMPLGSYSSPLPPPGTVFQAGLQKSLVRDRTGREEDGCQKAEPIPGSCSHGDGKVGNNPHTVLNFKLR